jgi:SAM-dependent methyltransferase
MPERFDPEYWEGRYAAHDQHGGHGGPNPHLVREVAALAPGTALEAGCGEGASAMWLAEHGWRVTAVDVSATALGRARARAGSHDPEAAARVEWLEADLTVWEPPRATFGLVTAHHVHPAAAPGSLLLRLAAAVSPGGTLLVVDHDPSDEHAHTHSTAAELAGLLDPDLWEVQVAETRASDVVLRGRRRV